MLFFLMEQNLHNVHIYIFACNNKNKHESVRISGEALVEHESYNPH